MENMCGSTAAGSATSSKSVRQLKFSLSVLTAGCKRTKGCCGNFSVYIRPRQEVRTAGGNVCSSYQPRGLCIILVFVSFLVVKDVVVSIPIITVGETREIEQYQHIHFCSLRGATIVARSALLHLPTKIGTASEIGQPEGHP